MTGNEKNKTDLFDNSELVDYATRLRNTVGDSRRLLLVQTPQFLFESINLEVIRQQGCYAYPPTGLQWLAASLAGRDLEIEICDLNFLLLRKLIDNDAYCASNWLDILDEQLERFQPTLVGVTCLSVYTDLFNTRHPLTAVLDHLMQKKSYIVLAGGPTVNNEIREYLSRGLCHFVIHGEGEYKLNFLMDQLLGKGVRHPPTRGIFFNWQGEVRESSGHDRAVTITGNLKDSYCRIALDAYHQVGSLNPYSRMAGQEKTYGVFQLVRGCRCKCAFCGVRDFMHQGVRLNKVGDVLDELRYLVHERGVRHFELLDDDFLAVPRVTCQLLSGMAEIRQETPFTWSANNGLVTTSLTPELLDLMVAAGCIGFKIGIESGSQAMLRRMGKPGTLESFARAGDLLQSYPSLFVGGNFIIGLFGEETFSEMLATFAFSCRMKLDWSSFTLFQVTRNSDSKRGERSGVAIDFIPTKNSANRELDEDRSLPLGRSVFDLPKDIIPSKEVLNHIWFTFNLVGNYLNNKNLKPGGNPDKFTSWVEAVQVAYPQNPYMRLFSALGHLLLGNTDHVRQRVGECRRIVGKSPYWEHRFAEFGLNDLIDNFPITPEQVFRSLDLILQPYEDVLQK